MQAKAGPIHRHTIRPTHINMDEYAVLYTCGLAVCKGLGWNKIYIERLDMTLYSSGTKSVFCLYNIWIFFFLILSIAIFIYLHDTYL